MQNVMRQIVVLNDGELADPDMLPPPLYAISPAPRNNAARSAETFGRRRLVGISRHVSL